MTDRKLYCFYRISDAGHPFGRTDLSGTFLKDLNRRKCFNNFLDAFDLYDGESGKEVGIKIFADNASDDTVSFIRSKGIEDIERTYSGSMTAFINAITRGAEMVGDEDVLYMVEDDYLHTDDSYFTLMDGIEIADYVSLYDSLDKYIDTIKGGNNPLISGGGENTKVILGKWSHYKYTNATTGTFAVKGKTLREDYDVIMNFCSPIYPHPMDFLMFRYLIENKNRKLICPIPGRSSHVGLELSPFVDWKKIVESLRED